MYKYDSSITFKYKSGYIHIAQIDGIEVVKANVDAFAYVQYYKSVRAAKIAITKHSKKIG